MIGILLKLLPRGLYNTDEGTNVRDELEGQAAALRDAENTVAALLEELLPDTTSALLADWERVYGLGPASGSLEDRKAALLGRVVAKPNLSKPFCLALAKTFLGYEPQLSEQHVVQVGPSAVPIVGAARLFPLTEMYRWFITLDPAQTNQDTFNREPLDAAFQRVKPAHTEVHVGFPSPFLVAKSQVGRDQL